MITVRAKGRLLRSRDALTLSAFVLLLSATYLARNANGLRLPVRVLRLEELIDAESPVRPQLPCGNEPGPSYPALTDSAAVKSWTKSGLGDNWKPPACTGWTEVGFTTLVTVAARFPHTSGA